MDVLFKTLLVHYFFLFYNNACLMHNNNFLFSTKDDFAYYLLVCFFRTMVSILMILPQGKAFESLSKRLQSLPSTKTSDIATKKISELSTKERDMLDSFIAAQLDRIESIQ